MKTLQNVIAERDALIDAAESLPEKQKKPLRTKVKALKPIILYLEHSPTEKAVSESLALELKKKKQLDDQFHAGHQYRVTPEYKRKWMKDEGMTVINKRIKILRYILS